MRQPQDHRAGFARRRHGGDAIDLGMDDNGEDRAKTCGDYSDLYQVHEHRRGKSAILLHLGTLRNRLPVETLRATSLQAIQEYTISGIKQPDRGCNGKQ
jgi:hypothetical protein